MTPPTTLPSGESSAQVALGFWHTAACLCVFETASAGPASTSVDNVSLLDSVSQVPLTCPAQSAFQQRYFSALRPLHGVMEDKATTFTQRLSAPWLAASMTQYSASYQPFALRGNLGGFAHVSRNKIKIPLTNGKKKSKKGQGQACLGHHGHFAEPLSSYPRTSATTTCTYPRPDQGIAIRPRKKACHSVLCSYWSFYLTNSLDSWSTLHKCC